MSNDRMSELLKRQAAAAELRRVKEAEAAAAAARAKEKLDMMTALWESQSKELDAALGELNAQMAPNDVKLEKRWNDGDRGDYIDIISIFYAGDSYRHTLRRLNIHIAPSGNVRITMGTQNHMPEKQYNFPLEDGSKSRWLDCLLDFIDINTPR